MCPLCCHLFICPYFCLSVCLTGWLAVCLAGSVLSVCLSACLPACLPACLSAFLCDPLPLPPPPPHRRLLSPHRRLLSHHRPLLLPPGQWRSTRIRRGSPWPATSLPRSSSPSRADAPSSAFRDCQKRRQALFIFVDCFCPFCFAT